MSTKIGLCYVLCGAFLFLGGCQQPEPKYGEPGQKAGKHSEPKYTMGWQQLRNGMDPVEVLSLIGDPVDITVSPASTFWYYSERGGDGPFVGFETRSMRVNRKRPPAG